MKHFRLSALVLTGALSLSLLTACGGKEPAPEESIQPSEAPVESVEPELDPDFPMESAPITDYGDPVVNAFWETVSKNQQPDMMDLDPDLLMEMYSIDAASLDAYLCKMPLMNTQATEYFFAKVKDGQMDAVKTALENRQAALEKQWEHYLPEQLELVQNYQLMDNGQYIMFAVTYEYDQMAGIFSEVTK